jgi:hypothetical protein
MRRLLTKAVEWFCSQSRRKDPTSSDDASRRGIFEQENIVDPLFEGVCTGLLIAGITINSFQCGVEYLQCRKSTLTNPGVPVARPEASIFRIRRKDANHTSRVP